MGTVTAHAKEATLETIEACPHCGTPVAGGGFCCNGCARVHALLRDAGLERFYALGGADGVPVGALPDARDHKWLEPIEAHLDAADGLERVAVDVQGVHCAACVWLIGELFDRQPHGKACVVNPTRGRIELTVEPGFPLSRFVRAVESTGYLLGPALKGRSAGADALTIRMGISLALAANTMVLSLAAYFGLSDGAFATVARQLGFALGAATVLVGGSFFIRSAWQSLRRGLLHLDLPIAVGIVLAFAGSTWSFFGGGTADYFDTLAIFVALMLVGRWVQERVVSSNRDRLLASDGTDGLWTRRVRGDRIELVRCAELREGDALMLAPGDLAPVDATLARSARVRLDWINGESEPRTLDAGATIPAGAFYASSEAGRAICRTGFAGSALTELLATPRDKGEGEAARWWDRLARVYVVGVLAAAAGAFALWMTLSGDLEQALGVTTAVLVVTCPCAFGIAAPLAHELVQAGLRRTGLFVRTTTLLSRAPHVRRVVFDKTGTLTTGAPRLGETAPLDALDGEARTILYNLAARSTHPKSAAVAAALAGSGSDVLEDDFVVHEEASAGLQARHGGHLYRLGRPGWAAPSTPQADGIDLVFARDGRALCAMRTEEALRPDAEDEIARLTRAGYETWILSGDAQAKVTALAAALGLPLERAVGDRTPAGKAAWLEEHGAEETLFVGDGINDSLAADVALAAGTPAIDRPFMPARSDFYFVTPGLAPIRRMLESAHRLRRVVRAALGFAVAYNLGAVALAYAGLVEPWVAAILMPVSSVATIAATAAVLARRSPWRS